MKLEKGNARKMKSAYNSITFLHVSENKFAFCLKFVIQRIEKTFNILIIIIYHYQIINEIEKMQNLQNAKWLHDKAEKQLKL